MAEPYKHEANGQENNVSHCAPALLALGALPPMLANARPAALLASAAPLPMLANAAAAALLALPTPPPMLAHARTAAFLAPAALISLLDPRVGSLDPRNKRASGFKLSLRRAVFHGPTS